LSHVISMGRLRFSCPRHMYILVKNAMELSSKSRVRPMYSLRGELRFCVAFTC
jgi:hypothetical protein